MTIQYDKVADAVYMKMTDTKVAKTMEVNDTLLIDMDASGKTVGIEILDASSQEELVKTLENNVRMGFPIQISENTPAGT